MINNKQYHDDPPETSGIAQFIEHDRCPRYLKQRIEPGEEADARDWREAFGLMDIALLGKGQEFEPGQFEHIAATASKVIAPELDSQTKTGVPDIPVEATWADSRRGRTTQPTVDIDYAATLTATDDEFPYILLYQVSLSGPFGEFVGNGHADHADVPPASTRVIFTPMGVIGDGATRHG
jgi:hypothetical protein